MSVRKVGFGESKEKKRERTKGEAGTRAEEVVKEIGREGMVSPEMRARTLGCAAGCFGFVVVTTDGRPRSVVRNRSAVSGRDRPFGAPDSCWVGLPVHRRSNQRLV